MTSDPRLFPDTSWTLLSAVRGAGGRGPAALDDFARRYHRPAFGYIMAIVRDMDVAQELTQAFFTRAVVSGRLFASYDRTKGSFRPYLKQALRNFIKDWQRSDARRATVPPGALGMGSTPELDVPDPAPLADQAMDREWVRSCLDAAFERVKAICELKGQHEHVAIFERHYMSDQPEPPSWEALAAEFDLKDGKQARHRADTVVRHFRLALLAMLVQELGSEDAAREEIMTLLDIA